MFIGQIDNNNYEYARINVKAFRRGGKLVKGFTRKLKSAGIHREALVAGSSMLGAKAGFIVGGPPGSLAGEFVLSNTSRRAINDYTILKRSLKKLKDHQGIGDLNRLQRLKLLHSESAKAMKERAQERAQDLAGDVGGFIGGSIIGARVGIPFAGFATGPAGAKALQIADLKLRALRRTKKV